MHVRIEHLSRQGWTPNTAFEPEFSLLKPGTGFGGQLAPCDRNDTLAKPCHGYGNKGLSRTSAFLGRLPNGMRASGIDVFRIEHEDAKCQFEMNYPCTDAFTSCDHFVFLRKAASHEQVAMNTSPR